MMHGLEQNLPIGIAILALVIAVLWIALPFAVFGIKKRLDAILVELKKMNRVDRP